MSRASTKKKKPTLQPRAQPQQPNYGSSFNAQAQALVAQMQAMQQAGNNNVIYSPGLPLQPQPGVNPEGIPRQFSFPLNYNTSVVDRTLGRADIPPFEQLRYLAEMYSGITLPERVWLDLIPGLTLKIGLTAEMKAEGYDDKDFQKEIAAYLTFFEKPDRKQDYHSWLRMAIRDQTQVDALCVFKRYTRGGKLYALEIVDGTTIKPLLDDWGRVPDLPLPAYQQYLWGGLPGDEYTTDQMLYYRESPRSNSVFGLSRVERFLMEVNQALRKKKRDLAMFTEGNIPAGLMEVPETGNWTADDIINFSKLWNSFVAGNEQQQVRVQFLQPGMKYIKTDTGEILTDFDYFLYKISCGCYGISLADIGFVEDIHKSSDKGQQNMMYRRTLNPLVKMYAKLFFTDVIHHDFHDPRFEASFIGYEEETDVKEQADTFAEMAGVGAIAPSDIAHKMGYPDVPKTGPFIMTKTGPFFLKDYEEGSQLRTAQMQSQLQGHSQAAQNPDQEDDEDTEDDEDSQQKTTPQKGGSKKAQKTAAQTTQERAAQTSNATHTGAMIAFMLDPDTAQHMALTDGEPAQDLHVTLCILNDEPGKLNPAQTRDNLSAILRAYASSNGTLHGRVGGIGRFTPSDSSGDLAPVIALVNAPGLQEWRRQLANVLESAGYSIASDFDYTPHCILAYVDSDAPMPEVNRDNIPLSFTELCLVIGDDHYYFPIGDPDARTQPQQNEASRSINSERAIRSEYRRWRACALHDIERGRGIRAFESTLIPPEERASIGNELAQCSTVDGVKAVFRTVQLEVVGS